MGRIMRKGSYTNLAVQPQKMARGLKFRIQKVEGLYCSCSENKGVDQLHGHHEADLRLCFRICKTLVFSRSGSNGLTRQEIYHKSFQVHCQVKSLQASF